MPEFSNAAGCVIEDDYVYLARRFDEFDPSVPFTRMSFYDGQDTRIPWKAHDLNSRTVSVCVWRNGPVASRLYVALSDEGDVELIGPSNQPHVVEHITGAGMSHSGSRQQGSMTRIRQIGGSLYACGSGYLTFRRTAAGWSEITGTGEELATVFQGYLDLNGHGEESIFAVGPDSSSTSCISFYNGMAWHKILQGHPDKLTSVIPSKSGAVYIAGWNSLLRGTVGLGFRVVATKERLLVTDMAEFQGKLYLATSNGLYELGQDDKLSRVLSRLLPELSVVSRVDSTDSVLWAFGPKDIAVFDGASWVRIADPDNAQIGKP